MSYCVVCVWFRIVVSNNLSKYFVIYQKLRSEFRVVMSAMISVYKTVFGSSLPPVVCNRAHVLFIVC